MCLRETIFRKGMSTQAKTKNPAGRRKWGLGIPILSIHMENDMNINIHIDIIMNIDIYIIIDTHI